MIVNRFPKFAGIAGMALLVIGLPVLAEELRGTVKSFDAANSRMVVSTSSWPGVRCSSISTGSQQQGDQPAR